MDMKQYWKYTRWTVYALIGFLALSLIFKMKAFVIVSEFLAIVFAILIVVVLSMDLRDSVKKDKAEQAEKRRQDRLARRLDKTHVK